MIMFVCNKFFEHHNLFYSSAINICCAVDNYPKYNKYHTCMSISRGWCLLINKKIDIDLKHNIVYKEGNSIASIVFNTFIKLQTSSLLVLLIHSSNKKASQLT